MHQIFVSSANIRMLLLIQSGRSLTNRSNRRGPNSQDGALWHTTQNFNPIGKTDPYPHSHLPQMQKICNPIQKFTGNSQSLQFLNQASMWNCIKSFSIIQINQINAITFVQSFSSSFQGLQYVGQTRTMLSVIYDHCTSTVKRKLIKVNCSDI